MLRLLSRQETKHRESAEQALDRFDRKEWKKLTRKLTSKARFFPLNSVVYQRLALAKLNEAVELYQQARKRRSSVAWHQLRIGLKLFRYVVENFLPQRYEVWSEDLKRMQDLLGEVHDLDVLRGEIRRNAGKLDPASVASWIEKIDRDRKVALQEFLVEDHRPGISLADLARGISVGTRHCGAFGRRAADRLGDFLNRPGPAEPSESKSSATPSAHARKPARSRPRPPSSVQ